MAQTVDQRDLLNSYRAGDMLASERIVRAHQNELLRSAFLLTGTAEDAVALARDAFLGFFRRLLRGDAPEDARDALLRSLGGTYLAGEDEDEAAGNGAGSSGALVGAVLYQGEPQRYRVDDERSRVLTTLELLDQPTRLGLVLRDFNMLDEEPVCQVLDETPFALRARLHPARSRVQDAGGSGGYSVRELLVTAATSAPRPELWPEVLGPLERLHAEEDERRQRYTYIAAGAVGLLLVVAALWLFDVFPFGGGDENAAAVATAEPTATMTPEPAPTPTVPDLASFDIPQGDVPAEMLMLAFGNRDGQGNVTEMGLFDPADNSYTPYAEQWFPVPSPDGRYLVGQIQPRQPSATSTPLLVAHDSQTGERLWEAETPGNLMSWAITPERIYAVTAILANARESALLLEYDLATGELIAEHPDVIDAILADATSSSRVYLWATPDNTRLFVALEEFGGGPTTVLSRALASYSLPDLTFESASIQTDSTSVRQFPVEFNFFDARVTPDGQYLYSVAGDTVRFRSARLEEDIDLGIQLGGPPPPGQPSDLRWIPSNDGRYLYVVAVARRQAAVVDLLGRRVAWSFPLAVDPSVEPIDWGALTSDTPIGFGGGLALSSDGRFMYLAGRYTTNLGDAGPTRSVVLAIDLTTGTVTWSREIPGAFMTLGQVEERLVVSADTRAIADEPAYQAIHLDPLTGEVTGEFTGDGLPEWATDFLVFPLAELYRASYGRAPAVEGTTPGVVETESTLPRVRIGANPAAVPAGGTVGVTVRVLDPVTGRFLAEESPQVRFDLASTMVLRLFHDEGDAEDIIVVASLAEPGIYRARAAIPATGAWSAQLTITGADGQAWTLDAPQLFEGVPSWEATDGRSYILRIRTDPAEPVAGESVTVSAGFVDVENGDPLPATAELLEPFPDELGVSFSSASGGVLSVRLQRDEQGVYQGVASFSYAGVWEGTASFAVAGEGRTRVGASTVTVVPGSG